MDEELDCDEIYEKCGEEVFKELNKEDIAIHDFIEEELAFQRGEK